MIKVVVVVVIVTVAVVVDQIKSDQKGTKRTHRSQYRQYNLTLAMSPQCFIAYSQPIRSRIEVREDTSLFHLGRVHQLCATHTKKVVH